MKQTLDPLEFISDELLPHNISMKISVLGVFLNALSRWTKVNICQCSSNFIYETNAQGKYSIKEQ